MLFYVSSKSSILSNCNHKRAFKWLFTNMDSFMSPQCANRNFFPQFLHSNGLSLVSSFFLSICPVMFILFNEAQYFEIQITRCFGIRRPEGNGQTSFFLFFTRRPSEPSFKSFFFLLFAESLWRGPPSFWRECQRRSSVKTSRTRLPFTPDIGEKKILFQTSEMN